MLLKLESTEAFQLLNSYIDPILIDVRTPCEWAEIGIPAIDHCKVILFSLQEATSGIYIENFDQQLHDQIIKLNNNSEHITTFDTDSPLFFLCRSGVRSKVAANLMIALGYTKCHNIIDGCQGNKYGVGWIANNLPWKKD